MSTNKTFPVGHKNGRTLLTIPSDVTDEQKWQAVERFASDVRKHFAAANPEVYLLDGYFDWEATAEDVYVAVVFSDEGWSATGRMLEMSDLGYDRLLEFGVHIHAKPVAAADWSSSDLAFQTAEMKARARRVD